MKKLITILTLLSPWLAYSQSTDIRTFFMSNTRKAEIYYGKLAYKNAIELYERVLEKKPQDLDSKIRIAQCYIALNDPVNTIKWYDEVMKEAELGPIHKYNYAQALCSLGNYTEAYKWYQQFAQEVPDDPRGKLKMDFLKNIDFYRRDSNLYDVQSLAINSINADFGAIPYEDGLVFLSSRDEDLFIKFDESGDERGVEEHTEAPLDIYYAPLDSIYTPPKKLDPELNTKFNEGPLAFYHNSQKVIITRNNYLNFKTGKSSDGKIKLKMFESEKDKNGKWSEMEPFLYNNDEYSVAHPALSKDDQTLYFSSDMPGGYGGSDIYYCKWVDGAWGKPVNLGPEINTPGDEMYPFITDDGENLYFTSDGYGGFGGMDIYRGYKLATQFGQVENLGFPINTSSDDFSFYLNEDNRTGYFSSNRPGGMGEDDVYSFDVRYVSVVGKVQESLTNDLVGETDVSVFDSTTNNYIHLHANEDGYFHVDLPIDSRFRLEANKEGYSPEGFTSVNSSKVKFVTDTVTVYMWKHRLFAEGRAFSNETHELLTGVTITLDNLSENKIQTIKTGDDGLYFFVLRSDKIYQIEAELEDHVISNFTLNTKGLFEDTLRNDFVLEEVYLDKSVIFFDFDKSAIKPESVAPLNLMVDVLKKHPTTYIFVGAHADAQGSFEYNQRLSERRAKSVVNYFKSKGIKPDRITWRGYGEELLINRCSDGVECPEEEQAKNRRAQLKIEHQKSEAPLEPDKK